MLPAPARRVVRRSARLPLRVQHFSSSPDARPPTSDSLQYITRILDRKNLFKRYQEHNVFPPSNWTLRNLYLHAQLQQPSQTEIDAVEFLEGARFACDRVIRAMHSPELIAYASEKGPKPPIADEMAQMFESTCYQGQLLPRTRLLGTTASSLELKELKFTGVYLNGVKFERPTRAMLKTEAKLQAFAEQAMAEQQQKFKKMREMNEAPNLAEVMSDFRSVKEQLESVQMEPEADSETLERLRLSALIHTTQTVETVSMTTSERVTVKSDVKTALFFESLVTEPQDVDWQILHMNQIRRVVSKS